MRDTPLLTTIGQALRAPRPQKPPFCAENYPERGETQKRYFHKWCLNLRKMGGALITALIFQTPRKAAIKDSILLAPLLLLTALFLASAGKTAVSGCEGWKAYISAQTQTLLSLAI